MTTDPTVIFKFEDDPQRAPVLLHFELDSELDWCPKLFQLGLGKDVEGEDIQVLGGHGAFAGASSMHKLLWQRNVCRQRM
jgi:hypothetical protein